MLWWLWPLSLVRWPSISATHAHFVFKWLCRLLPSFLSRGWLIVRHVSPFTRARNAHARWQILFVRPLRPGQSERRHRSLRLVFHPSFFSITEVCAPVDNLIRNMLACLLRPGVHLGLRLYLDSMQSNSNSYFCRGCYKSAQRLHILPRILLSATLFKETLHYICTA